MARSKKKVTEVVEKVEDVISPIPKKKVVKKDKTIIETESPKKKTPKKTKKKAESIIIVNEPPKKRTRKKKEEEPKLASTPPPPKPKKPKKPILKVKNFYEFEEGKYVLGDVEELFDEKLLKKMKTSIKKLSKKNHGKDDKLGIHYFKVGEKCIDLIEYQSKMLTPSLSLILCKDDIIKSGKLRFCKRFTAKE